MSKKPLLIVGLSLLFIGAVYAFTATEIIADWGLFYDNLTVGNGSDTIIFDGDNGNITALGNVTANAFYGDGSHLTNLPLSGYVPYTGASSNLNFNGKNMENINTLKTTNFGQIGSYLYVTGEIRGYDDVISYEGFTTTRLVSTEDSFGNLDTGKFCVTTDTSSNKCLSWEEQYNSFYLNDDLYVPTLRWSGDSLTIAQGKTAYDHSQDNSQAHSDYLLNNANDVTSGSLTASGFTLNGITVSDWSQVNQSGGDSLWVNNSGVATYNGTVRINGNLESGFENFSNTMINTGIGSTILGYTAYARLYFPGIIDINKSGYLIASGKGSIVAGSSYADTSNGRNITSSGTGSFAGGYPSSTGNILGSGDGSFTWGAGALTNKQVGTAMFGAQNTANGSNTLGSLVAGVGNIAEESYCTVSGYNNKCGIGALFGAGALGTSNIVKGRYSWTLGFGNKVTINDWYNYLFGYGITSKGTDYAVIVGTVGSGKEATVYMNNGKTNISGVTTINNLKGSYGGGSAHVCVYNNGTLYASDGACP